MPELAVVSPILDRHYTAVGSASSASPRLKLPTLNELRGIAALAVCWYHMTNGWSRGTLLRNSGANGWMGVEMFFVISGFIIPYSMFRGGYRLTDAGRFAVKRLLRLDPPYLVSLILVLALNWSSTLSPLYHGAPFKISASQLLLHLGYLNVFFGYPWLNVVYWTLAVEFQYYLLAACAFPVVASGDRRIWIPAFAVLTALAWLLRDSRFVFFYLPLFLLGMSAFKNRVGQLERPAFLVVALILFGAIVAMHGLIIATIGLLTALTIALVNVQVPPLDRIGVISYSLYLVHVPIGGRVVNLGQRYAHSDTAQAAVSIAGVLVSLIVAWLLYAAVERPAQRWSSRIQLRRLHPGVQPNSQIIPQVVERVPLS